MYLGSYIVESADSGSSSAAATALVVPRPRQRDHRKRSHRLNHHRIFLALDFEILPSGQWWRLGCALVPYATGEVTEARLFACARDEIPTGVFWEEHALARQLNVGYEEEDVDVVEEAIAVYFDDLRARLPTFFLISDMVSPDIDYLNMILKRRGRKAISFRGNGMYLTPVSVWSYGLGLAHVCRVKTRDLLSTTVAKRSRRNRTAARVQLDALVKRGLGVTEANLAEQTLTVTGTTIHLVRHTPVYDAISCINRYFNYLDISAELSEMFSRRA